MSLSLSQNLPRRCHGSVLDVILWPFLSVPPSPSGPDAPLPTPPQPGARGPAPCPPGHRLSLGWVVRAEHDSQGPYPTSWDPGRLRLLGHRRLVWPGGCGGGPAAALTRTPRWYGSSERPVLVLPNFPSFLPWTSLCEQPGSWSRPFQASLCGCWAPLTQPPTPRAPPVPPRPPPAAWGPGRSCARGEPRLPAGASPYSASREEALRAHRPFAGPSGLCRQDPRGCENHPEATEAVLTQPAGQGAPRKVCASGWSQRCPAKSWGKEQPGVTGPLNGRQRMGPRMRGPGGHCRGGWPGGVPSPRREAALVWSG